MEKRCVFCDKCPPEVKITKEHVMRAALSKYLPRQKRGFHWHQRYSADGGPEFTSRHRKIPQSPFEWTVNDICKTCNEGWLETLVEVPAEKLLAAAMQGRRIVLNSQNCQRLALWAAKTAAVRALMDPLPRSIPPHHYGHIRVRLEPPPNTLIWLAHTTYIGNYFMRHSWRGTPDSIDEIGTTSHISSIVYGHMALYVIGASESHGLNMYCNTISAIESRDTIRIWPVCQAPSWPNIALPVDVTRKLTDFVPPDDYEPDLIDEDFAQDAWSVLKR